MMITIMMIIMMTVMTLMMMMMPRSGSVQSVSTAGVSEMTVTSGQSAESGQWQCAGNPDTQTPSCRALAGSLASFEVGTGEHVTGITTEGVPLLLPEETEFETNSNPV